MQTNSYDPTLEEAKKTDSSVVSLNPKVGGTCPKDGGMVIDGECQECGRKVKQESYVNERKLTSGEMDEREKNVKGMKKSFSGFKKRYGKDAKSVMYATATKMAKEEVVSEGDYWHPDPEKDRKLGGPGPNQRAREDRGSTKSKSDYSRRLKPGESYMDFAKRKARGEAVEYSQDTIDELNRYEKETGKDYKTGKEVKSGGSTDKAFTSVKKFMRTQTGKPAGQRKKVPGKKPPVAGSYGAPKSPAQKVAMRRAAAKRSQDNMSSRFD